MGGYTTSCAEEEDVTLKDEAQANGWKSIEGCTEFVQMSCVRTHQEDALHVRALHAR